jgi:hypothetical protein
MSEIFEFLDRLLKKGNRISMWFFYIILTMLVFGLIKEADKTFTKDGFSTFVVIFSIWAWITVRWLKRKGYISGGAIIVSKKEIRFLPFVLTNVVAPVLVAYFTFLLTGQTSITLLSVPIMSFLSAKIELG